LNFTVTGSLPVLPSGSQDTHASVPNSVCDPAQFARAEAEGKLVASGFSLIGAPDAGTLLRHFLAGSFSAVNFPAGSTVSEDLLTNPDFQSLNAAVQAEMKRQLNTRNSAVMLTSPTLRRITLSTPADLEWSFSGTQGLEVTGSGAFTGGDYIGSLTYTVEDSYGFSASDTFRGIGAGMRYLQTACGNPPYSGGAHWFPDSITVTVAFDLPAT
jgi:hypothetical protein